MSKLEIFSSISPTVALVGNPNSGKTFLFNKLTAQRVKVANYPGTTVGISSGQIDKSIDVEKKFTLIDLPGLYDLETDSPEEEITNSYLSGHQGKIPDLVLFVLDAQRIKQGLYLLSQLQEKNIPLIIVVNKIDFLKKSGSEFDVKSLENELQCEAFVFQPKRDNYIQLAKTIAKRLNSDNKPDHSICSSCTTCSAASRYQASDRISKKICKGKLSKNKTLILDRFFLHPVYGLASFLLTMFMLFWLIFHLSSYPMDWIDQFFVLLSKFFDRNLEETWLKHLLLDGIIAGVGGILVFLPQILLLFFLLSILENSGYLARIVCLIDKYLKKTGLPGNAFIPMLTAHTCAIPAVLATRIIPNKADRWRTIFILPFFSCSARIPVYVIFTSFIFNQSSAKAALAFIMCYLAGIAVALLTAMIISKFSKQEPRELITELPSYCIPSFYYAFLSAIDQGKSFVKQAGSFILIFSVIIWVLSYLPGDNLNQSYLAMLGKFINPVFEPLGFDWRIVVGILTSFVARETIISTFSIIFNNSASLSDGLAQRLSEATLINGEPLFTFATSLSLLIFFIFALQCVPTLITVWKETRNRMFVLAQFTYALCLAYLLAYLARCLVTFLTSF